MECDAVSWRRRWFVKPGLTGLARIHDETGHEPETELRYDVEYIRRQSLWFDLKIVIRQIWKVLFRRVGHRESRNIDVVPIVNRSAVGACRMPGSTTPDSGRRSTCVLQYLPISLLCLRKRKSGLETLPRVCPLFGTDL